MKHHTLQEQVKTIKETIKAIKTYFYWKEYGIKAKYFKKSEFKNSIFHLEVIIQITDKSKVSVRATKLRKLLIDILKYKYKESLRKTIIEKLTKYSQQKKNRDQKNTNARVNRKTS